MKEKIIFITTASLEEDFAEGKTLDYHQVKGIYEKYGEDETINFMTDNNIGFVALDPVEAHITEFDFETLENLYGIYPSVSYDQKPSLLTVAGGVGDGPGNVVHCKKVRVEKY